MAIAAVLGFTLWGIAAADAQQSRHSVGVSARAERGDAAAALSRGHAALAEKNFARAFDEFRAALRLTMRDTAGHEEALIGFREAGVELAKEHLRHGRRAEAEQVLREVIAADPGYEPARRLAATVTAATAARVPEGNFDNRPLFYRKAKPMPSAAEPTGGGVPSGGSSTTSSATEPTGKGRLAPARVESSATPEPEERPAAERARELTVETRTDARVLPQPSASASAEKVFVRQPLIKVYFATDRLPSGESGPSNYFGVEWNKSGDHLVTGYVTVSIPPGHREGAVERPFKLWIFERAEDAKKHFVLTELKVASGEQFYSALRGEYDKRRAEQRDALVFIHGFRVSFDTAAYRTAQIAYDLNFEGVPVLYSWPSQGRVLGYEGDLETADWSSPHLQSFLERVARESGALRIHLVAHSMGNRLLTNALSGISRQPDIQPLFENVIMAAPDLNAYTFSEQIWPGIKKAARRFTLYASSQDQALIASKKAKGKNDFDRLGEAGPKIVVVPGLDTIDASGIDTSLLGHSYIEQCKPVLADVTLLIKNGFGPLDRKLSVRRKQELAYWAFP